MNEGFICISPFGMITQEFFNHKLAVVSSGTEQVNLQLRTLRIQRVCLFFAIAFFSACGTVDVAPTLRGRELEFDDRKDLIRKVLDDANHFKSLKAIAKTTVSAKGDRAKFRYTMIYNSPNSVRLDSVPDGSAYTVGIMLSHDSTHAYFDSVEKKVTFAESADELMAKVLRLNLSPSDLVSLLVGKLPSSARTLLDDSGLYVVSKDDNTRRVLVHSEKAKKFFEFDAESFELMRAEYFDVFQDQRALLVDCIRDGQERSCRVDIPRHSLRFDFKFSMLAENVPVKPETFLVEVPEGYSQDRI